MKNLIAFFSLFFLGMACFAFAEEKLPFVAQVASDNLNIRAGYNVNFEVVSKLKKDEKVTVLEKKFNWCRIELPQDATCFISTKYVNRVVDKEGAVASEHVNVRARPDLKASVLCQLSKSDPVIIVDDSNKDWYQIKPPKNCFGWVNGKYLQFYSSAEKYAKENKPQPQSAASDNSGGVLKKILNKIAPPPQPTFEFENTGIVKKSGFFFKQPANHRLLQNGKIVAYLKSDKYNLDNYLNLQVNAKGNLDKESQSKYPVVIVEDISIIE